MKSAIVFGATTTGPIHFDLDTLLKTRLLIQASSGGGKSWVLRRLIEQMFGKVQIIVIDPEGEFATLREKFAFVLVGKGGETPADIRSAALVAEKLLELHASAVCDIYELKPHERHEWVKRFLTAMMEARKELWHPVVIIVDEAHKFCPEKDESVASGAMIDIATRGRKRGFCAVFATQRLSKLDKDASAELLNRAIGPTIEEIDVKKAALALGVAEYKPFANDMKKLQPGEFFVLGRAIANEMTKVKVGTVQTTHPEMGTSSAAVVTPTPEKVKALLPKLGDLPKEAEEKARTEADLRSEIRSLKAQLAVKPKPEPPKLSDADIQARADKILAAYSTVIKKSLADMARRLKMSVEHDRKSAEFLQQVEAEFAVLAQQELPAPNANNGSHRPVPNANHGLHQSPRPVMVAKPNGHSRPALVEASGDITAPQMRILRALAEFESIGRSPIPKTWVAVRAEASSTSSSFQNNLGSLRARGLIDYAGNGTVLLTAEGRAQAPEIPQAQGPEDMLESCKRLVSIPQAKILDELFVAFPQAVDRESLAEKAGASPTSSSYQNNLGSLRSAGMLDYTPDRKVKIAEWIFMETA